MDLDELQSVQSRERQTDSLQQLRATFYQDAADYIGRLETERDRAADRADDPWNSPEVGRLNDDIDTAEQTVEAIYERRVGKIVKMASLAAADMPTDDDGLTEEERSLFETLVGAIENNREAVFAILDGESAPPTGGTDPPEQSADSTAPGGAADTGTPDRSHAEAVERTRGADAPDADSEHATESGDGRASHPDPADLRSDDGGAGDTIGAADVMAGGGPPGQSDDGPSGGDSDEATREGRRDGGGEPVRSDGAGLNGTDPGQGTGSSSESGGDSDLSRSTVKITSDVGEIFGVDERAYDLTAEDVVTLPEPNAGPLVEDGAAERLD